MHCAPWEYLFRSGTRTNFPDLYNLMLDRSVALLVATVVIYNVRTRQLHRHAIYVQMYEWILWTGVITFGLMPIYWVFSFDFIIVLLTIVIGLAVLVWIRFVRFPPYLAGVRAPDGEVALLLARAVHAPRDHDPGEVVAPAPPPLGRAARCRWRSAGSGSATAGPTGPPGRPGSGPGHRERARRASSPSSRSARRGADHPAHEPQLRPGSS